MSMKASAEAFVAPSQGLVGQHKTERPEFLPIGVGRQICSEQSDRPEHGDDPVVGAIFAIANPDSIPPYDRRAIRIACCDFLMSASGLRKCPLRVALRSCHDAR